MQLKKLRILLLFLVISGGIQSQNFTDSVECLSPKEFDFYAQAVIDRNFLRKDTANSHAEIKVQDGIIRNMDAELTEKDFELHQKDNIITTDTIAFKNLSKKYSKEQKKVKRLKQSTLIFLLTTAILGIIVILK